MMNRRGWDGEIGARTPQEVRTTETRQSTLRYDVGKPLLLALLNGIASVLVYLALLWATWALRRTGIVYVLALAWSVVSVIWYTVVIRTHGDAWTFVSLLLLGAVFALCAVVGVSLDQLSRVYHDAMIQATPAVFALVFFVSLLPASIMESWFTSAHFEYALSMILGGHPNGYAPWWTTRRHNQPAPDRPILNKSGRRIEPELSEADVDPNAGLTEFECFLNLVDEHGTLARDKLCGAVMANGQRLTKNGWYRCIAVLDEQGYIEKSNGGAYDWTLGNSVQTVWDGLS